MHNDQSYQPVGFLFFYSKFLLFRIRVFSPLEAGPCVARIGMTSTRFCPGSILRVDSRKQDDRRGRKCRVLEGDNHLQNGEWEDLRCQIWSRDDFLLCHSPFTEPTPNLANVSLPGFSMGKIEIVNPALHGSKDLPQEYIGYKVLQRTYWRSNAFHLPEKQEQPSCDENIEIPSGRTPGSSKCWFELSVELQHIRVLHNFVSAQLWSKKKGIRKIELTSILSFRNRKLLFRLRLNQTSL